MNIAKGLIGAALLAAAAQGAQAATLDVVRQRGAVACGTTTGFAGFSAPDAQGKWQGLDVDLCRAIAAAVFGDADKIKVVPLNSQQRFTALQSGEVDVLTRQMRVHPIEAVQPVLSPEQVLGLQAVVRDTHVDDSLKDYIVRVASETRTHPDVELGASPRGSIALMRLSQAIALIDGRDYIVPDDVKSVAISALAHRTVVKPDRRIQGVTADQVIVDILDAVRVPVGEGIG